MTTTYSFLFFTLTLTTFAPIVRSYAVDQRPRATPSEHALGNGWSPKPTQAPYIVGQEVSQIFGRDLQLVSYTRCQYPSYSFLASSINANLECNLKNRAECVSNAAQNVVGCCNNPGDATCKLQTTCFQRRTSMPLCYYQGYSSCITTDPYTLTWYVCFLLRYYNANNAASIAMPRTAMPSRLTSIPRHQFPGDASRPSTQQDQEVRNGQSRV